MKSYHLFILPFVLLLACAAPNKVKTEIQTFELTKLNRFSSNHLRGLSMFNDSIVWASGVNGTVIYTADGVNWNNISIQEASDLDFRDIHAFSENEAIVLSAGNGVSIFKTIDSGKTWNLVFQDTNSAMFYDGFDFNTNGVGVAFGDPIDGRMTLLKSLDYGNNWEAFPDSLCPTLDEGEAGFAASGTGIKVFKNKFILATGGGSQCHMIEFMLSDSSSTKTHIPIASGNGTGVFSISFWNEMEGIAVGGNYVDSANATSNCAITDDGGKTWELIHQKNPNGYRSCAAANEGGSLLLTSGRTGIEYSIDKGKSWKFLSDEGFYSCAVGRKVAWLVGRNGKMGRIDLK